MKKLTLLIACLLALSLCLCACGGDSTQDESTEPSETETQKTPKELAESCIDKTVQELYALIGEPGSSDYAPSCLGPGEDGNLYYDGFTVYTYREGETETVRVVE